LIARIDHKMGKGPISPSNEKERRPSISEARLSLSQRPTSADYNLRPGSAEMRPGSAGPSHRRRSISEARPTKLSLPTDEKHTVHGTPRGTPQFNSHHLSLEPPSPSLFPEAQTPVQIKQLWGHDTPSNLSNSPKTFLRPEAVATASYRHKTQTMTKLQLPRSQTEAKLFPSGKMTQKDKEKAARILEAASKHRSMHNVVSSDSSSTSWRSSKSKQLLHKREKRMGEARLLAITKAFSRTAYWCACVFYVYFLLTLFSKAILCSHPYSLLVARANVGAKSL
jgi:hypothetical protein